MNFLECMLTLPSSGVHGSNRRELSFPEWVGVCGLKDILADFGLRPCRGPIFCPQSLRPRRSLAMAPIDSQLFYFFSFWKAGGRDHVSGSDFCTSDELSGGLGPILSSRPCVHDGKTTCEFHAFRYLVCGGKVGGGGMGGRENGVGEVAGTDL